MVIEKDGARFKDIEKQNLVIKQFTPEEILTSQFNVKSRQLRIRMTHLMGIGIFLAAMITLNPFNWVSYCLYIGIVIIVIYVVMFEMKYYKRFKYESCSHYVEIEIQSIERVEVEISQKTKFKAEKYYPVIAKDTTSGYITKIYLLKDIWDNVKVGDVIKFKCNLV